MRSPKTPQKTLRKTRDTFVMRWQRQQPSQLAGLATILVSRQTTVTRSTNLHGQAISFLYLQILLADLGFHFYASAPRAQPASQDKLPTPFCFSSIPSKTPSTPIHLTQLHYLFRASLVAQTVIENWLRR